MKKILFMLSVIVFGISPAVSAVSDWQLTKYYAPSTDGENYLRDVYMTPEGKFVDKMGSAIKEADLIDPDFTKNLTPKLEPSIPNSTPSATPSANTAATNTHWGVNRETGAMEKLTKKGNRFYDQAGNQISAKGENIKTYKLEELDKANKYAEKIAKERMSGGTAGGASGAGAAGGGTGGIAQKIGYEGVGKITAGQALQVGMGLMLEKEGLDDVKNTFLEEGEVGASGVFKGAVGGAKAAGGIAMALNAIPMAGQVGYGVAIGVGAAIGGGLMLTRVASQSDCVKSDVYPQWTHCCNVTDGNAALMGPYTENLAIGRAIHSNKFGYINYCVQKGPMGGVYKTDQGWKGKGMDDDWSDPELRWCKEGGVKYNFPAKGAHYEPVAFWETENGHTVPCWKWRCIDPGMKWENNDCVPDPNAKKTTPKNEQPDNEQPGAKKTCNDLYAGHPKRLACCKAGKNTKWTGDIDNGSCYCVVPETQLPDDTKTWNAARCVEKSDVVAGCKYTIACSKGISMEINLSKEDLNGLTCADFNKKFAGNADMAKKLADKNCSNDIQDDDADKLPKQEDAEEQRRKVERLTKAKSNLDAFFSKVNSDKSVWKNADGSFNGVRLASDLTAGVVLGTVGGVVSGVLIKKSQVEKGFDALNCTINGQKVADWGDEFSVGLRR